jgi:hypothetical protein
MTPARSPSRPVDDTSSVAVFMTALEHPHKPGIETLRQAILAADARITEAIKWNAPSFQLQDHFLTFKLFPPKHIQLIFHVGAKPLVPPRSFTLDLPAAAVKWAAPDRCVLTITDSQQAAAMAPLVAQAVRQWLGQLA